MNNETLKKVFIQFFKPHIRVLFNWTLLNKNNWNIELQAVSSLKTISSWYMPWNVDENKNLIDYKLPNAKPIRVKDVPEMLPKFSKERQNFINFLSEQFKNSHFPINFVVPAYNLGGNKRLLLDGNHKMSALVLSQVSFNIMIFTIIAPVNKSIIPELRHWE